jgi:hypothetical protein
MKFNFFFYCFFLLFIPDSGHSQNPNPSLNYNKLSRNDWSSILKGNQPLMTKRPDDVELRGSPFVFETYEKGSVIISDSLQSQNDFKFKMNAEDDEIWILTDKEEELVLQDRRIIGLDLIIGNKMHSFRKAFLPDIKNKPFRYVEVLYNGNNFSLIKSIDKTFEEANAIDKGVTIIGRNYNNYKTAISYYIKNDKKGYKKISLKKADIYKVNLPIYNKYRDTINSFNKAQNLSSPLDEAEAVVLIAFIDTLK